MLRLIAPFDGTGLTVWDWLACAVLISGFLVALLPKSRGVFRVFGRAADSLYRRVSQYVLFPYIFVALLSLLANVAQFRRAGEPVPAFHDEFSYLLAGDTFAQGRLANPPHPLWHHFETFHVLQQPTYASKYPLAQGLTLAVGQLLTGFPIFGAWLMLAFAVGAVLWAFRAFLPGRWAFYGACAFALHPLILRWGSTYWGGGIALAAGALVLGASQRMSQMPVPRVRDAISFSLGVCLFANSRPFEGFLFTLMVTVWMLTKRAYRGPLLPYLRRAVGPMLPAFILTVAAMLWYNRSVTGSPLTLPYVAYVRQYNSYPELRFLPALPLPVYHVASMMDFYTRCHVKFGRMRADPLSALPTYLSTGAQAVFFPLYQSGVLGFLLTLGIVVLLISAFGRGRTASSVRGGLWIIVLFYAVLWGHYAILPHYAAPITTLVFVLALIGLRQLSLIRLPGRTRVGFVVGSVLLPTVAVLTLVGYLSHLLDPLSPEFNHTYRWQHDRFRTQLRLMRSGGKHLILVGYVSHHYADQEWVYNGADLANAPVIWAHSLSETEDADLVHYYSDRHAWRLTVNDLRHPELQPYTLPASQETSP